MSDQKNQTNQPAAPAAPAAEAAPAPKLAAGLFQPFRLGSTLAQAAHGNVMEGTKPNMLDYVKQAGNHKNQSLSPEDLAKIGAEEVNKAESDFDKLKNKLAHKKNPPRDPAAVAAKIGREKLGEKEMARRAAEGRKEHAKKSMDEFADHADSFYKALFAEKAELAPMKKWEPSKEDLLNQLSYKLHDMKKLKDASWMIESEVPGVMELAEKQFTALKKDVADIARKYKKAPEKN